MVLGEGYVIDLRDIYDLSGASGGSCSCVCLVSDGPDGSREGSGR